MLWAIQSLNVMVEHAVQPFRAIYGLEVPERPALPTPSHDGRLVHSLPTIFFLSRDSVKEFINGWAKRFEMFFMFYVIHRSP